MRVIAKSLAGLSVALVLGSAAATPVTYNFTFTDLDTLGQIDATGSFVTGDGSATDSGYFLLTSLTFTSVLVNGTLQTGSAVQTSFDPGAAYDPMTGAFVNHSQGRTYPDYSGGNAYGLIGVYNELSLYGYDFSKDAQSANRPEFSVVALTSSNRNIHDQEDYAARLFITAAPTADPGTVPEPGSIALIGLGLIGLAVSRRSSKR